MGWYALRLRSMSPAEVSWRVTTAARMAVRSAVPSPRPDDSGLIGGKAVSWDVLRERFRAGHGRPVLLDAARMNASANEHPDDAAAVIAAADAVLDGRYRFFGYPEVRLDHPINWHRDPLSGVRWPALPAHRINHRFVAGDPKWIWELNRLQHLPWLAQAWLLTADDRYADAALDQLDSWLDQNPPGIGIAWRGAFEAGIRAISVAVAMQGLRDAPALTTERYRRVVHMLAASAHRCWRDRSRFSSANNHLVGELAGLATVALLHPELAAARRWERQALLGLRREADRQILPDGAGAEQAVGYQVFTAELLLIVAALVALRDGRLPAVIHAAVDRSARYLGAIVGEDDPDPRYGDDDNGFALRLTSADRRTVRAHLASVSAVTGIDVPVASDLGAACLGAARPERIQVNAASTPPQLFAPHGGLVLLRASGRRVTMDVGPLGYLSTAAHGHADALAVTVAVAGRELIGDPGAGSYYGHPEWRRAHRGTRMHATVTVDDEDQSVIGGPFLWSRHARVTVRAVDLTRGVVDAEHDGYRRLGSPAGHRRWLFVPPDESDLLVVDLIDGPGPHRFQTSWPLHPELDAVPDAHGHLVNRNGSAVLRLAYGASTECTPDQRRGDLDSQHGWWSERLEHREPAWLVGSHGTSIGSVAAATVLRPLDGPDPGPIAVEVELTEARIDVAWPERDRRRSVRIDRLDDGAVRDVAGK